MNEDEYSPKESGGADVRTTRSKYDWESIAPSTAVIEAVADAARKKPEELDPLYGSISPDGIDDLFEGGPQNRSMSQLFVSFPYNGYEVTISGDGVITVRADDTSTTGDESPTPE